MTEPDACPRCGSTDPAVRNNMDPHFIHPDWCEDEWHDRPTGADPVLAVTGRRIGATGIHLRPDGSECNYSVGPDSLICMKCGWPGIAEAPTGADDLATRLSRRAEKHRSGMTFPTFTSGDADIMDAAAARLRELEAAIVDAVRELDGSHYPDPTLPGLCIVCSTADGDWPCTARMVADDLRKLL